MAFLIMTVGQKFYLYFEDKYRNQRVIKATALSCNVSLRTCNEYKNKTIV